jgi:hypothetical protein
MLKPGYIVFQRGIFMKKMLVLGLCAIYGSTLFSCASGKKTEANHTEVNNTETAHKIERKIAGNVPDSVKKAVLNAPDDVLIGIGSAKLSNLSMAQNTASARARAELAHQVNSLVVKMVAMHKIAIDVDPEKAVEFEETITVQIARANLVGTEMILRELDDDGVFWVVVTMKKENAAGEIGQLSPKSSFPEMADFDNEQQFMAAFLELANEELHIRQ